MRMRLNTDTLKIGSFVNDILSPLLKVYPIVADKSTEFPFAAYRRTSFSPKDTKDIYNYEEIVSVEVIIVAKTYNESIALAQSAKDTLEGFRGIWNGTEITDISLVTASEDWQSDAYVQRLGFTISLDNERKGA